MIIKGKSWKTRGYKRLYNYMEKGASKHAGYHFYTRNFYSKNKEDIIKTFIKNSRHYKDRKDGVHLYHDIISITRSKKISLNEQKAKLHDIVNEYCEKRCANNLVVGFLHEASKQDIHYHLMISANEYEATKKHSLTTTEFENAKIQTELYCLEQYPELEQEKLISQKKAKNQKKTKISDEEYQLKKRTGKKSKNDIFEETLKNILASSQTKQAFFDNLSKSKIGVYIRSNKIGFLNQETNKKYKLDTLGLENEFAEMSQKISLEKSEIPNHKREKQPPKEQRQTKEKQPPQATKTEAEFTQTQNTRAKETSQHEAPEEQEQSQSDKQHEQTPKEEVKTESQIKAEQHIREIKKVRENKSKQDKINLIKKAKRQVRKLKY